MSPCTHNSRRITLRQNVRNNINMKANKNLYRITGKIAALLSCLLLFSCNSDDMLDEIGANGAGKYRDNICFGITSDESVQTKGNKPADNGYTSDSFVLRSENSDDTLCVNAIVTDGIELSDSVKQHAMTRGAAVTQDDFYDKFHVLAYWKKDGTSTGQFYMNTDVTDKGNNLWSSDRTYIWPGKAHTLTFYAWAPADAGITSPSSPESTTLEYTVPTTVTDQKDVVVATTEEIAGNANTTQPLAFRHICTAVKFKVGDQMQAGTIKKITISGVHNSGAYDMASDSWQLGSNTTAFSIEQDIEMTGNESGSMITDGENTFMMLPQELPAGAKVEIIFHDSQAGTDRTFSASIGGMTWPQGKTVTYTLSITPEYKFEITEENPVIDAHYVIFQTTLKVSGVAPNQSWTITAPTLGGANVTIQRQSDMNSWARQGYWTDRNENQDGDDTGSARGGQTISGTGEAEIPIAIFVPENTGETPRTVNLVAGVGNVNSSTIEIEQLCPNWNGNLGCERLESDPEPWGFYWDTDFKIIYDLTNCDEGSRRLLKAYIDLTSFFENLSWIPLIEDLMNAIYGEGKWPDLSYLDMKTSGGFLGFGAKVDNITINLGDVPTDNIAEREDDGQRNTQEIYNFEGIQFVNQVINIIENMDGYTVATEGEGLIPSNNAAIACMKLNSWNIISVQDEEVLTLTSDSNVPDWYLPARGEVSNVITDEEYPLNGEYWTSTAVADNSKQAWKYNAAGTTSQEERNSVLNVRAVRKKP